MAEYLTIAQLLEHMPANLRDRTTDNQRIESIQSASDEADTYARAGGYALPLSNANQAFKNAVADVARLDLAIKLGMLGDEAEKHPFYLAAKEARKWLGGLRTGDLVLDAPLAPNGSGGASTGKPVLVASNPRRGW